MRGHEDAGAVLFIPNFSVGSVLGTAFAALAARFFDSIEIVEAHHAGKVDSPSGTAVRTAELIGDARAPLGPVDAPHADQRARGQQVAGIPVHSLRLSGVLAEQRVVLGGERRDAHHRARHAVVDGLRAGHPARAAARARGIRRHRRPRRAARPAASPPGAVVTDAERAARILMAVLLVLYVVLVGWRAVQFIATGEPVGVGIGIALIVLPLVAAWALWRELAFGVRSRAPRAPARGRGRPRPSSIPVTAERAARPGGRGRRVPRVPRGGRGRARLLARVVPPRPRLRRRRRPPPRARAPCGGRSRSSARTAEHRVDRRLDGRRARSGSRRRCSRCGRTFWLGEQQVVGCAAEREPEHPLGNRNG